MSSDAPSNLADITINELRHRIKNLAAIIQALVLQSLRTSEDLDEAAVAIQARLDAVARSVDLMLRTDWDRVSLSEIAHLALAHAAGFPGRVHIGGPEVYVPADWVTMLILALQELETNALKYGALSSERGAVHLTWAVREEPSQPRSLCIAWREQGGSAVVSPAPAGFGSRLATTLLQRHLKGRAELDFKPSGVTWSVVAPYQEPEN